MDFKNRVKMAIEDFRQYIDDEDFEFAYGTIDFLSNRPNSHRHNYSEDVIKEYAPSILGKWVIGEYRNGDMSSHTMNQVIQGRIPENQEIKYRYDEEGYLIASVDIVLSKLYANAYKVLRDDNYRYVSIEELIGFTPETESYVDGTLDKEVIGFHICGVTILGKNVNPSVPNANIQLVQMSEDNVDTIDMEYAKYSELKKDLKDDKISIILNKLEEISNKLENNKEETMEEKIEVTEVVENTEPAEEVETVENAEVEEVMAEEQPEKIEEPEEEKMACGDDKEKMAELETKLSEAEAKMSKYEEELAELREFKLSKLETEKESIVTSVMSRLKGLVDETTYSKYETSGKDCEYDNIGSWKNEVLASITDVALEKMSELTKEDGILDMGTVGMSDNDKKHKTIYD